MIRTTLWMAGTLAVAIGAIAISDARFDEPGAQLACTGHASRQLDDALFTARALSQSGEDPVCTPPVEDSDDLDAVTLSHHHEAYARRR